MRLYWQARSELEHDYHTILHLFAPSMQRSWAVENQGVLRPPTRVWDPDKYYIETMRLKLPDDIPPVTYSLVAGLVSSSGERLAVPGTAQDLLHLRDMAVAPTRPNFFQRVRPTTAAPAETSDGLRLQGYDLLPIPQSPTLRLFWETGAGVTNDWTTYIHLTDAKGDIVAQFDGPPLAGLQPTGSWHSNAVYIDNLQLKLAAELAPGSYLLRIGLYDFNSGERLPFLPSTDAVQDHFDNGQLLIHLSVPDYSSIAPDNSPAAEAAVGM